VYVIHYLLHHFVDRRPFKSEDGVTAIEYGLIAAFMVLAVVAVVAGVTVVGVALSNFFSNLAGHIPT
jgi:Flp pilus assembly pilin Flp